MACSPKAKLGTIIAIGVILLVLGILCYTISPFLIEAIVKSRLILATNSYTYDMWKEIPIPIYLSFYMFNITNAEKVRQGVEHPSFQELGPYTFLEKRQKQNISFHGNGTVSYDQKRVWSYVPDKSNGSLSDIITHLNVGVIGANYIFRTSYLPVYETFFDNFFNASVSNSVCMQHDCSIFYAHNVSQLLFEGYDDRLIKAVKDSLSSLNKIKIPYDKFGWFYARNNTASDGFFGMFTGKTNIEKLGYIDTWNHESNLENYGYGDRCSKLGHTSAGDFQPPYTHRTSSKLNLFVGDLCRSFSLDYLESVTHSDIDCRRYVASETLFDYSLEENKCYCPNNLYYDNGCKNNGVSSISSCVYGTPVFISFPHFMHASSVYRKDIYGLRPDKHKHTFFIDIEPTLGVPVNITARLQINYMLEKDSVRLTDTQHLLNARQLYPQFWFAISAQIDNEMSDKMKLVLNTVPLVADILSYVLMGCGVLFLCIALYINLF